MKEVILFPGSFSPMHIGHLCLANYAVEQLGADELWFMLTPTSPFKSGKEQLPQDFRADWGREVVKGYPKFLLNTDEFALPEPNYTFRTIEYIHAKYPECHFRMLIGMDNLLGLTNWYKSKELIESVDFVIYPRPGYDRTSELLERPNFLLLEGVPTFEISSTRIRHLLKSGYELPFYLNISLDHPLYQMLIALLRN